MNYLRGNLSFVPIHLSRGKSRTNGSWFSQIGICRPSEKKRIRNKYKVLRTRAYWRGSVTKEKERSCTSLAREPVLRIFHLFKFEGSAGGFPFQVTRPRRGGAWEKKQASIGTASFKRLGTSFPPETGKMGEPNGKE